MLKKTPCIYIISGCVLPMVVLITRLFGFFVTHDVSKNRRRENNTNFRFFT